MNIFCKYGIHKLKVWYEDGWETCKVCTRCGEEQSVSIIPGISNDIRDKRPPKTIQEKRRKKLAKIKIHGLLRGNKT